MEIQHASLRLMGFKRWGYIKSLQLKVKFKKLYQAYFPTLLRDLIYGITRHFMMIQLATPGVKLSLGGEAFRIFISIAVACMASAPGNELRAYRLQPKKTRLPPGFKSARRGNWIRPFLHRVFFLGHYCSNLAVLVLCSPLGCVSGNGLYSSNLATFGKKMIIRWNWGSYFNRIANHVNENQTRYNNYKYIITHIYIFISYDMPCEIAVGHPSYHP